jgi:hypothetical protein
MKTIRLMFNDADTRAIVAGPKRGRLYVKRGQDPNSREHLAARLLNGVESTPTDGCWNWARASRSDGRAQMTVNSRTIAAARVAFMVWNGEIPDGAMVLHKCDNPRCIRPDHLELGDQAKNMGDCAARGRSCRGASNGKAVLSFAQVDAIRDARNNGLSQDVIAAIYGVSRSTIGRILRGEAWA